MTDYKKVKMARSLFEDLLNRSEKLKEFEAIGTIEEFRALREKAEPKKPTDISKVRDCEGYIGLIGKCPCCGEILEEDDVYCNCGQTLDWQ